MTGQGDRKMRHTGVLFLGIVVAASTSYAGDTLEEYAAKCEEATGVKVDNFNCDAGTKVPTTHHQGRATYRPQTACDRPNQLNQECDPGSRFQILTQNDDAYAVAHCRKQGLKEMQGVIGTPGYIPGEYGDIAVIQYNNKNGATCFYQALAEWEDDTTREKVKKPLNAVVKSPSNGPGTFWMTPGAIQSSSFRCGGCHDNGPIIRSPYLSQVKRTDDKPLLPGVGGDEVYTFNDDPMPYYFVGSDFASWKAFKVKVKDNECNTCHRMGVNNVLDGKGTARILGIRATSETLPNKNKLSEDKSPMWMTPDDPGGKERVKHADSAKAIKDCAKTFTDASGSPLPNSKLPTSDACRITQFAGRWKLSAVRWEGAKAYFFKGDRYSLFDAKVDNTKTGGPKSITTDWSGLSGGIDAAIMWGTGKAYVFKGDQFVRVDLKTKTVEAGPATIASGWPGVWAEGIDAAVPWSSIDKLTKARIYRLYFFKGDQYLRYTGATTPDAGFPKSIKSDTEDFPAVWAIWPDGIDAVIQWDDDTAYFFKGDQYLVYDVKNNKPDPKFPKPMPIKDHWPNAGWHR
jgi:hypothetical protein